MRISEIYPAPQGEGILAGEPMAFVRVAGCNLSCSWCDSAYTWKKGYEYVDLTPEAIMSQMESYLHSLSWVSITGGEPTLYADVGNLIGLLADRNIRCLVETNGLRQIPWLNLPSVFVSCSPKLASSGQDTPMRRKRVREMVGARYATGRTRAATQWKFVIANEEDLLELPRYCADVGIELGGNIPVYLQPDGMIDPLEHYVAMFRWLTESAPRGVRVVPQLHRLMYGSHARGI